MGISTSGANTVSTEEVKNVVRQAIAERGKITTTVLTRDVVDSLIRHKRYKGIKQETVKTYRKHLNRFAAQFPTLLWILRSLWHISVNSRATLGDIKETSMTY